MRKFLLLPFLFLSLWLDAASTTLEVNAPTYAGERIFLYRYLDLFTLRQEPIADALLDDQGHAVLTADVSGTTKAMLRIGAVSADFFLRGSTYHIGFPPLPPGTPRTLNGTAKVQLEFTGIDALDVNMLTTDLYERLDAFVAEDLMAKRTVAHPEQPGDSLHQQASRFVNSKDSEARIDTFDRKLRRFYAEVPDPWFRSEVEYGLAALHLGPRANDRQLFDRYLKDRPLAYDVPAYVHFIDAFFADHLVRFPFRNNERGLVHAIRTADADSVKALLAGNDLLRDNDRLRELVMITELRAQYWGKLFDRNGMRTILQHVAEGSAYPEHRIIAKNILWDLTAMKPGTVLPSLKLTDERGEKVIVDSLLQGHTLFFLIGDRCSVCEQELVALEQLHKENGSAVRFIGVLLGDGPEQLARYRKAHPTLNWTWLMGGNDGTVMEALRARNLPLFHLLKDRELVLSPAPLPSSGLGPVLHKLKVQQLEQERIRPDRGTPPKR